jgi:hypothetical protein
MATALRVVLAVVVLGGAVGCSSPGAPLDDGNGDVTPQRGHRAFNVSIAFTPLPTSAVGNRPDSHTFTMSLDLDQKSGPVIIGWPGGGVVKTFTKTADGFRVAGPVRISIPQNGCDGYVTYDALTFRFGNEPTGSVAGDGHGTLSWIVQGDLLYEATIDAHATGVPDDELPRLAFTATEDITDPLSPFTVTASEPLAPEAYVSLVSAHGERFDLQASGTENFTSGFLAPTKTLRYGEPYQLIVDGAVDLAGNVAGMGPVFTTHPVPPLIPEDGFETSPALGGGAAQLIDTRNGTPIAGDSSLYVPPGVPASVTQLAVRLAVAPGDKVVRFSYRTVEEAYASDFSYYRVFTPGGDASGLRLPASSATPTPAQIAGEEVALGPVYTAEIPLPATATTEVYFARTTESGRFNCMSSGFRITGIIIDDLRVE